MVRFGDLYRARVARRIIALFVVSSVVPVAVMALIAFGAVNGQLGRLNEDRLARVARSAGQSVLERVRSAESVLGAIREDVAGVGPDGVAARPISAMGAVAIEMPDAFHVVSGRMEPPAPLSEREVALLADDGSVLRADPDSRTVTIGFSLRPGAPSEGTLWTVVPGDSIWSSAETFASLPTVTDFCVLAGRGRPLYCSSGSDRVAGAYDGIDGPGTLGTFSDDEGGTPLLAGFWSFYPNADFEGPPWTVIVAADKEAVYAPLDAFTSTFGWTVLIAVLLVVLLSHVQIRRTMEPLVALGEGTKRFAEGALETRVAVDSDDEFGALAGSFNEMAAQLGTQFAQFEAIQSVGQAALGARDRDEVILTGLKEIPAISGCRSAAVLVLADPEGRGAELVWRVGEGDLGGRSLDLSQADLDWLRSQEPVATEEPDDTISLFAEARRGLGSGTMMLFTHRVKGKLRGATLVELPDGLEMLSEAAARRVRQLADQIAVALHDVHLVEELEGLSLGALVAMARAIDAKSQWTAGHSERVTELALALGRAMRLDRDDLDILHRGGLLHDVGKIGVPNAVLDKAGPVSLEEIELIRAHPVIGERILKPISAFASALPLVRSHHERWDGLGYPDGLKGEEIHPLARVLSVADAFDAMVSPRPYRPGRPADIVLDLIVADSGTQFEPRVVDTLVRHLEKHGPLMPRDP